MNNLMKIVISLSFSGSILVILLFTLKPFFRNRVSKRWQYCYTIRCDSINKAGWGDYAVGREWGKCLYYGEYVVCLADGCRIYANKESNDLSEFCTLCRGWGGLWIITICQRDQKQQ